MLDSIEKLAETDDVPQRVDGPAWLLLADLYPARKRFYFLFKQGVGKTNVQHFELLSLLQMHTKGEGEKSSVRKQFIGMMDYAEFVDEQFNINSSCDEKQWDRLSKTIEDYCDLKIIYEPFENGAIVYLPKSLQVNLALITAEAGYVHSSGDLVDYANTHLVERDGFELALDRYIAGLSGSERVMLAPYCHEDFTDKDRDESQFLKDGLDNVKINISKSYLGDHPLHTVVAEYADSRSEKVVCAPSDYKKSEEAFKARFSGYEMVTIWIISDLIIDDMDNETLGKRFFIAYRQRYKNDNIYHHYEENKPAWVSHTTLPHSLAGAMVNLARPWLPTGSPVICDPFCGSGTIFLEAQKFPGLICYTSDQSPLAERILQDNISFFKLEANQLQEVISSLNLIDERSFSFAPQTKGKSNPRSVKIKEILEVVESWNEKCGDDYLQVDSQSVIDGFKYIGDAIVDRIVLYIVLRANVRGRVAMSRDGGDWYDIFQKELKALTRQMENHCKSVKNAEPSEDQIVIADGRYSQVAITPKPYEERSDLFGSGYFNLQPVQLLPRGRYDAIVCDPPYGFNTESDRWAAEDFASAMIPALVESLKPFGQIVMASPRTSYSGRRIPLALRSDSITRAILEYCARTGRQCWTPSSVFPAALAPKMQPPYYWKAEKSLNRKILHFWIRASS